MKAEDSGRLPAEKAQFEDPVKSRFLDPERAESTLESVLQRIPASRNAGKRREDFLNLLRTSPDPDLSLSQFDRMIDRARDHRQLAEVLDRAELLAALLKLLGSAPALAAWLAKHADSTIDFLETLTPAGIALDLEAAREQILTRQDARAALLQLQSFRRREGYRIASLDLLGRSSLAQTLSAITRLAEFVIATLLELLHRQLSLPAQGFAVIALGKLGSGELNFSSDIDLIYLCEEECEGKALTRLARQLTRKLSEGGAEGRLYRVDLRLRPMGRTGEVLYPLDAYRQYFETHADTFDRLVMMKARFVAGDPDLGSRFEKLVQPFVYRKYLDPAAIDEVRWLKKRSDARLSKQEREENIKLGTGGIREVEFFVQSLQLLYGGQDPEIRCRGTLPSLRALATRGYISEGDEAQLREGYSFLRKVENFLQLESDLQIQSLPQRARSRLRLARLMGFEDRDDFEAALRRHGNHIHEIFLALFESGAEGELRDLVLNPALEDATSRKLLHRIGIDQDEKTVLEGVRSLAEAPAYPVSPSNMRTLLARILPNLLQHAARSGSPAGFLARFDGLCERLGARSQFYQSLIETPEFAHRVYQVLLLGDSLSRLLFRFPEVIDLLSEPSTNRVALQELQEIDSDQPPPRIAPLIRDYKEREELKLALKRIRSQSEPHLREDLSAMADRILRQVMSYLIDQRPLLRVARVTLLALGKLGGAELTFHSDLDLVLLYAHDDPELAPQFDDLVRDLKRLLEGQFSGPSTYQLDFRLRPEGRKSSPATPLESFQNYCHGRMQFWERLAYTRARAVFSQAEPIDIRPSLGVSGEPRREDFQQLMHLRERKREAEKEKGLFHLKLDPGGLFDMQLGLEFLCYQAGHSFAESQSVIQELRQQGSLNSALASLLLQAVDLYQRLETALRLTSGKSTSCLPAGDPRRLDQLAGLCDIPGGRDLTEQCRWLSSRVSDWFDELFAPQLAG